MIRLAVLAGSLAATLLVVLVGGVSAGKHAKGPYTGQQTREVSSLSARDIADLNAGRGWGLAKPAELNGYPGPLHVLELAGELALTDEQEAKIKAIFAHMKEQAQAAGRSYIANEAKVDALFKAGSATPAALGSALATAAHSRAKLREIHLSAHLATTPLLTRHQRHLYQQLRGYNKPGHFGSHSGQGHN